MMLAPEQIAAYMTAAAFGIAAGYERFINRKRAQKQEVDQGVLAEALAFKERGDLMLKQANEYHDLLEKEYEAHQQTRKFHHDQATIAQEKLSKCNELCLDLQSRTDITRLEKLVLKQTDALEKMSQGITELLKLSAKNHHP